MPGERPIPLLGDIALEFVQRMEHSLDGGFVATRISGLPGELQQRSGRPSHRIRIGGVLLGEKAAADLGKLQTAAETGAELTFAADIASALELQQVVITGFRAVELAGHTRRFSYALGLAESPPLPPPAELDTFGGLGDFGLGDLGFDTDVLGELEGIAGEVSGAVDAAMEAVDQLSALANLDGLSLGAGVLEPVNASVSSLTGIAGKFKDAAHALTDAFS